MMSTGTLVLTRQALRQTGRHLALPGRSMMASASMKDYLPLHQDIVYDVWHEMSRKALSYLPLRLP